ncbi:MAG: hypothetical protein COA79_13705 [Planctomycetota bacterium]|nr:MAG: hypothetical protein COA79_13705 [Planctomycetota bacterium]
MVFIISLFVFAAVSFFTYALFAIYKNIADSDLSEAFQEKSVKRSALHKAWLGCAKIIGDFLASIFITPIVDVEDKRIGLYKKMVNFLDKMLVIAGRPLGIVPNEIVGSMFLCTLCGTPAIFYLGYTFDMTEPALFIGVPLSFFMPLIWLNDAKNKRQVKIFRSLPYAIDLVNLAVEAGMDFTIALRKISEKLQGTALGEEFYQVVSEINLGKSRSQALKDMAERIQLEDILSFANAIIQADELGSSMGPILRIQSSQLRIKRSQIAEEQAMKAPVKLIFPLVAVFLPAIMLMLGGIIYVGKIMGMNL